MRTKGLRGSTISLLAAAGLFSATAVTCGPEEAPPDGGIDAVARDAGHHVDSGVPSTDAGDSGHPDLGPPVHSSGDVDAGMCWRDFAGLKVKRAQTAATVLPDGRVFVVGGNACVGPLASAEIYHPASDHWMPAAPMPTPRRALVATVLDDGRVLVTGGASNRDRGPNTPPDIIPLHTVELYDPVSNTWSARAPMIGTHWLHEALKLEDGRVLVVGGTVLDDDVAAEVYDPEADAWTAIPFPGGGWGPRFVKLIPLEPERVLVVAHGSSWIIDVSARSWTFAGQRDGWSAEYVNAAKVGEQLLTFGGVQNKWSERYHPDAGRWEALDAGYALGRDMGVGIVFGGGRYYLMTGGYLVEPGWANAKTSLTDVYDSELGAFRPVGRMTWPRLGHAIVELRPGVVLVIGGGASDARIGSCGSTSVEVFDPTCLEIDGGVPVP